MLLLQFVILNALCFGNSAHIVAAFKEPLEREKLHMTNIRAWSVQKSKGLKRVEIPLVQGPSKNTRPKYRDQFAKSLALQRRRYGNAIIQSAKEPMKESVTLIRKRRQILSLDYKELTSGYLDKSRIWGLSIPLSRTKEVKKVPSKRKHLKRKEQDIESPIVALPIQKIIADVGVSFQKYLSPDIFHDKQDGNANSLNIELLTTDGNQLFDTSWIKLDQSNLKLYGFPLKGNQDEHTFILKATNSKGKSAVQKVTVVVFALEPVLNHYVHICTTMTLSDYGGSVEQRLRFAKAIANYVFPGVRTDDVWIWRFQDSCVFITFRHLPTKGRCNFHAIQTIEKRLFNGGKLNSAFQLALKGITKIVSANVTVLNECKKSNVTNVDDGLGWLRDVAPVFILIAVVAVPTLISCIVCREVRRRQATMRQLQDRRMKEDREQMLLQAAEYKHECGFDSESEDGDGRVSKPCRIQEEEGKRFFGFSRIADIILPEVVIDTVKQGTEILNTFLPQESRDVADKDAKANNPRRFSAAQAVNPMNKHHDKGLEDKATPKSLESVEPNITTKMKSVLKFLRNPLDISSFETEKESEENAIANRASLQETRKLSKLQPEKLLPSISSIFGLEDGRRRSLNDIKETMGASIKKRFKIVMNTASFKTVNDVTASMEASYGKKADDVEVNDKQTGSNNFCEKKMQVSQRVRSKSGVYVDFRRSVPAFGSRLGDRFYLSDPLISSNSIDQDKQAMESKCDAKQSGLFQKIIHQSKSFIINRRNRNESDVEYECDIELEEIKQEKRTLASEGSNELNQQCGSELVLREPIKQCKHWERNRSIQANFATCGAECFENQMQHCQYDDNDNPFKHYYGAPMNRSADNTETKFYEECTQESHISRSAVKNEELLENANRYYVNMGESQLEKERVLIEAADGRCRALDRRSGRKNLNDKEILAGSIRNCYEFARRGRENSVSRRDQLNDRTPKGLQHYDPSSGNWYPAYKSLKNIVPSCKMFSLLESFKKSDQNGLNRENTMQEENLYEGNLRWYNLKSNDDQKDERKEIERNRRKTGMDIGSHLMFNQFPGNHYEQYGDLAKKSDNREVLHSENRKEPRGIWTENIYDYEDEEDDENELLESSDDETDLQDLIFKIQDERSRQYRYFPDELYGSGYYCEENVQIKNYGEDEIRYSERMYADKTNECIEHDDCMNTDQVHFEREDMPYDINHLQEDEMRLSETMHWSYSADFTRNESGQAADSQEESDGEDQESATDKQTEVGEFENCRDDLVMEGHRRRRSLTDSQLQLSTTHSQTVDSPTKSEPGCSSTSSHATAKQKERRKSFLERQRRVEIPEKSTACNSQSDAPKIHVNPIFVIEERNSKDEVDERGSVEDRFDFVTVKRMQSTSGAAGQTSVRMRKLTYHGPFPTAHAEAEKIRKQDADIIEHQTKGFLERRRQSLQHIAGSYQPGKVNIESEPIAIQNRAKREEVQKRIGMRRFSTPSMESWTSTPEKYYYDATGDNCISEEDVNCAGMRKDKEKKPLTSGRGRAKEYTQRLLQGVSPKIRRHSTSILGHKNNFSQSGSATSNTGTFLGKIGEGKFVQTIQTKLGKKDSKAEEPKSPISKEKEKYMEEEKQVKGSPLTAIRNTLFLFSGGK